LAIFTDMRGEEADLQAMRTAVTIHDVARQAGVSITTVSHVLSGRGRVSAATRQRVQDAIDDLGYQANIHAQRLASRRSRTLAMEIATYSSADNPSNLVPNSNYFLEVLNTAARAASDHDYELTMLSWDSDSATLDRFGIDGVLLIDPSGEEPLFAGLSDTDVLVVTNGRIEGEHPQVGIVDNDHARATLESLVHLQEQGYHRPALITTDLRRSYTRDVAHAYEGWCSEHGVESRVVELPEPPTQDAAVQALEPLLSDDTPPDAVLASAEDLALGVLHGAGRFGISIPENLGVVSVVDSSILLLTSPAITATHLFPERVGAAAVKLLIAAFDGEVTFPTRVEIPTELRIRGSTLRKGSA